jgi:hypothetical protein
MTVDAWKPASSVDRFYKKGRFISDEPIALRVGNKLTFDNVLELLVNQPEHPLLSFQDFF